MTWEELRAVVKAIVTEVVKEAEALPPEPTAPAIAPPWGRGPEHRPLPPARSEAVLAHLVTTTPARIITGRTGTRYLTHSYLGLRADHAIALDAVESEVDEAWGQQQGWIPLRTRAKDHLEFLLHPEQGRALDEPSRARCEKEADKGVDVQLIAGDGLSALALEVNGPPAGVLSVSAETRKPIAGRPVRRAQLFRRWTRFFKSCTRAIRCANSSTNSTPTDRHSTARLLMLCVQRVRCATSPKHKAAA